MANVLGNVQMTPEGETWRVTFNCIVDDLPETRTGIASDIADISQTFKDLCGDDFAVLYPP